MSAADTYAVLEEVRQERKRQDAAWGEQNHPNGEAISAETAGDLLQVIRQRLAGEPTWKDVLWEEVTEAFEALEDNDRLRAELVQVAAVATAWVEAIDRRAS